MNEIKIERLDNFGNGIGYLNGKIIFVKDTLPEELVNVEVTFEHKNYLIGKLINIIIPSKNRIKPLCKYFNECGGCQLQTLSYENTVKYKFNKIKDLLLKNHLYNGTINFIENKNQFNYRNKIELKIENNKIGFYQNKTHDIVSIDECLITKNSINNVISDLKKLNLKDSKVTIRTNYNDEILLIFDTEEVFDYTDIVKNNKVVGIIKSDKVLYNDSYFTEVINDLYFKVSYNSFFQVNEYICSKLFELIDSYIKEGSVVADLYCGVGTLSIVASKKASKVYGIEIVENAIINAITNAKINNSNNCYFSVGSVPKILPKIDAKFDTIIVDPPRAGLDKSTIETILKINPETIIYTSCDPQTLIRDLKILKDNYDIKEFNLLDMFSYTYHVESVSVLHRKTLEK